MLPGLRESPFRHVRGRKSGLEDRSLSGSIQQGATSPLEQKCLPLVEQKLTPRATSMRDVCRLDSSSRDPRGFAAFARDIITSCGVRNVRTRGTILHIEAGHRETRRRRGSRVRNNTTGMSGNVKTGEARNNIFARYDLSLDGGRDERARASARDGN